MANNNKSIYSLLLILIIVFIFIALKGLQTPQPGDENVYYYMAKLINEGKVPYRDFFFAHPPFHIYLIALIYRIFGFNIVALKLIPLISTLISAYFVFKIAKNRFGNAEAVISFLLFLFSYSAMFNSVFSFGIDVATMLLVVGVYFLFSQNSPLLSGIFFGLAGITRLLSLVPIFIVLAVVLFSDKKKFLKISSVFIIIFLLVNGILVMSFGKEYLTQVYKYHLLKSFGKEENFREYIDIVKLNWLLFLSALTFVFVRDKKPVSTFVVISTIYMISLTTLKKLFGFYFIVALPFLAIIGGYSIVNIIRRFKLKKKFIAAISIVLVLIFMWNLLSDTLFLEKIGFKGFERGKDLTDFIVSNSNKDTMLFGDDSVVPLLALSTNKKIALDFVDTNNQVFISGVRNLSDTLSRLKGKNILFVIRDKQGISYFNEVKEFLNKNCKFLSQFHDKIEGNYIVYKCK